MERESVHQGPKCLQLYSHSTSFRSMLFAFDIWLVSGCLIPAFYHGCFQYGILYWGCCGPKGDIELKRTPQSWLKRIQNTGNLLVFVVFHSFCGVWVVNQHFESHFEHLDLNVDQLVLELGIELVKCMLWNFLINVCKSMVYQKD